MPYQNYLKANIRQTSGKRTVLENPAGRSAKCLVVLIYGLAGFAFLHDITGDDNLAYGIIYAPLVATAVLHRGRRGLWILSFVAFVMVVIGVFVPVVNADLPEMIGNRVLSILAILATAAFVQHSRATQDRLAAATRRAEAAERIKTDVLHNLSQEIRTPLHALLGVLTLTMANSRPDQRESLGRIGTDAKRLLATIDNLIDLTQIEEHEFRLHSVDIATIARSAAESARPAATERQIDIAVESDRDGAAAIGDSWAMRRILDNLLANAVRLTPPGGSVSVLVARTADMVTASVSDTGTGFPLALAEDFAEDALETDGGALPEAGGTGLALSSRLARAMNGRLTARNQPGMGARVSLSLPAADRAAA
jgi:signal transduction histidine kinase